MAMDFGKLNFAVGFNRTSAFPLDANSYFENYDDAVTAASGAAEVGSADSAYYIGQIIIIKDSSKGVGLYQIDSNKTLIKFGQASSADELKDRVSALETRCTTIEGKLISSIKLGNITISPVDGVATLDLVAKGQTVNVSGVSGSFTGVTGLQGSLGYDTDEVESSGSFTPAGTIEGSVVPSGSVSVTLKDNVVNSITNAGTQASFTEGAFTPASLSYAASDEFVKEGIKATVGADGSDDEECLIFEEVTNKGTASVISSFNGGSKAKDSFTANTLPTFGSKTIAVQSASFTGASSAIDASFTGTSNDVKVSGNYQKANLGTVAVKTAEVSVAVNDFDVAIADSEVKQKS